MASFTITLTERGKSELHANFFPPLELNSTDWEAGLTSFDSYFAIPNLIEGVNSTLYLIDDESVPIHNTSGKFFHDKDLPALFKTEHTAVKIEKQHAVITTTRTLFNSSDDSVLINLGFKKGRVLPASSTTSYVADRPLKTSWSAALKKNFDGMELPSGKQHALYFGVIFEVPTGTYELADLRTLLKSELKKLSIEFEMEVNLNTQRCGILCSKRIDFNHANSFANLLGFKSEDILPCNKWNWSEGIVHVFNVINIGVSVSCCQGDIRNGTPTHVIYQFTPSVPPGYRMTENPQSVTYHSVIGDKLEEITVKMIDQDGKLINFGDEIISIRLHFKRRSV